MTEELISLYKELYENGGVLFRPRQDQRLILAYTPPTKLYSQHVFPEYEYSKAYAQRLLKQLRK